MDSPQLASQISASPDFFFNFDFEDQFPVETWEQWMRDNYHQGLYYTALYLIVVFSLVKFMTHRKPYDLRLAQFTWNITLAVFSLLAAIRFCHEALHVLFHFGLRFSACNPSYLTDTPTTAFWTYMYGVTKILEFGDTIFLVLRKKRVIFLHWFHHGSVVVLVAFMITDRIAGARWMIATNCLIHTLMYTYYAFRCFDYNVPRIIALLITTMQVLHMMLGFFGSGIVLMWSLDERGCSVSGRIAAVGVAIYFLFTYLFLAFFYRAYWKPTARGKVL